MRRIALFPLGALLLAGCQDTAHTPMLGPSLGMDGGLYEGLVLEEDGFQSELIVSGLSGPEGAAMLGDGVTYIVESWDAHILKILGSGEATVFAEITPDMVPAPFLPVVLVDAVIAPSRGIFVTQLYGQIFNIGFNGSIQEHVCAAGVLCDPQVPWLPPDPAFVTWMAFDAHENLYATLLGGIADGWIIDVDGEAITVVNLAGPRGITFDVADNMYVVHRQNDFEPPASITRFTVVGGDLPLDASEGTTIATQDALWEDLVFWPEGGGDLFVSGQQNIWRVRLDGVVSLFASGLTGGDDCFAFNALAVNRVGKLIVSDYCSGNLFAIAPTPMP